MVTTRFKEVGAYLIHDSAKLARATLDSQLSHLGFAQASWRILGVLSEISDLTQSQISSLLSVHKVAVGATIDQLETGGWIERSSDASDRRAKKVHLTTKASPVIQEIKAQFSALEMSLVDTLSQLSQAEIIFSLRRLRDDLRTLTAGVQLESSDETVLWLLLDCDRLLMQRLDLRLREFGFSRSQWFALSALYFRGDLAQSDLAESLGIAPAALGKVIDQLECASWVCRAPDSHDRRIKRLSLMPAKLPQLESIRSEVEASHARLFQCIDALERERLDADLRLVRAQLCERMPL
ncbi:MAG: MarR family transcriptional regulator [Halioglobus sp.]